MAIKLTAESFLAVIKQSGLIEQDQLKRLLQEFKKQGVKMEDSRAIAEQLVARKSLTRWQADKLLKGKHKGFFLGKYRLLSLLGKGGMSSVYLAEHVLMRRRCAIKVLPAKRVHDTSYLGRFYREAQAVAALDHINIVRAYDVDKEVEKDTEIHFLVMEYVQGESLQDVISRKGVLDFVEAAEFMRQAAEGLHHAHAAGMVHRDIKPGNLLIDKNNVVKILDLGLARFFDDPDEESLTVAHDEKVLGTADYLAPEQALDSHTVDERADIYSLGCTFYFLLAGHPPFTEGTLAQRLMAHQTKAPPPIESKRKNVPSGLITIINKMMTKGTDERYQTGEETAAALAEWLVDHAGEQWKLSHPGLAGTGSSVRVAQPVDKKKPKSKISKKSQNALIDTNSPGSTHDTQTNNPVPVAEPVAEAPVVQKSHQNELASFLSNLDSGVAHVPVQTTGTPAPVQQVPVAQPPSSILDPMKKDAVVVAPAITRRPTKQKQPVVKEAEPVAVATPVANPSSAILENQDQPSELKSFLQSTGGMITAIVAGLIFLAALTWGLIGMFKGSPTKSGDNTGTTNQSGNANKGGDPRHLIGSDIAVGSSSSSHFATIKEALAYVKSNYQPNNADLSEFQVIKINPGSYHERIVIDNIGKDFPAGVHLIAGGSQPVVLSPSGSAPVIQLANGLERFLIEGLTINATNKNVACELKGHLVGTTLSNLKINGFNQTGIMGYGPAGFSTSSQQIKIKNITFKAGSSSAVGIRLGSTEENDAQGMSIVQCRFLGKMQAGVKFEGNANHIDIRESIFAQNDVGILFEGVNKGFRVINVTNNTFYKNNQGIVFTNIPGSRTGELGFYRNLFAENKKEDFIIETDFQAGIFLNQLTSQPSPRSNLTNKNTQSSSGARDLFSSGGSKGKTVTFVSTDSTNPNFLKVKSPIVKLSDAVNGLKPYHGAVAP